MIEQTEYITKDLVLAATLLCLKFHLAGCDTEYAGTHRKRYWFKFDNTDRLKEAVEQILNRQINVEPFTFNQNQRLLKSLMVNDHANPTRYNV